MGFNGFEEFGKYNLFSHFIVTSIKSKYFGLFFSAVIASNIRISCQIIKYYYFYTIFDRSAFYAVLK